MKHCADMRQRDGKRLMGQLNKPKQVHDDKDVVLPVSPLLKAFISGDPVEASKERSSKLPELRLHESNLVR